MSEELVLTENRGHIRILTLNRPDDMNAFNTALASALGEALDALDGDPEAVSYTHLRAHETDS